ncbi:hypothetical protein ACP70R_030983 [Stipagrostis hirtigluma subsp. patula]
MAAMRSAFAMLGRRSCGSAGSSAAATMAGRGLAPPLPWNPPAGRNLESWRRFSSKGWGPADEAEHVQRTWWQGYKDSVNQGTLGQRAKSVYVHTVMVLGTSACYVFTYLGAMKKVGL